VGTTINACFKAYSGHPLESTKAKGFIQTITAESYVSNDIHLATVNTPILSKLKDTHYELEELKN